MGFGARPDQTGSVTHIQETVLSVSLNPDPRELVFTTHTHTHAYFAVFVRTSIDIMCCPANNLTITIPTNPLTLT